MKVISLISILFFSGCVITGIDKPSSYDFELWWKNGASTVEVQMAMLECGYHSIYWNASMSVVEVIESNRCMEGIGFEKKAGNSFSCKTAALSQHPACTSDSVRSLRSVDRRLNSPFCKEYPKAYACQPPGSPIPTDAELEMLARQRRIESSRSRDPGTPERKLTEQIQKQNNRGMDQLQRFTK